MVSPESGNEYAAWTFPRPFACGLDATPGAAECSDGDCDSYDQGMPKRHQPTAIVAIIVPQVDDIHEGLATLTHFANFNAGLYRYPLTGLPCARPPRRAMRFPP